MASDPSRLPASVVRGIRSIIDICKARHPDRNPEKPIEFTCTIQVDPTSGKILTLDAVAGWIKVDDDYQPKYGTICMRSDGIDQVFGRIKKPK